jgi:hypothetical protein
MNPLIQRQKTNPPGLVALAYFRSNFGLNMLCAVCIVLISPPVWATEPSYGDCLQQGGTPEFDGTGRYVHCRSGVGPRPNPQPHDPPHPRTPPSGPALSVRLQTPETANVGQDVARMITLGIRNSGGRPAPAGFRIQLGLYGQDPPILRYQVKTITSAYHVDAGATVTYRAPDLGRVVIPIGAMAGDYNFCAKLENTDVDCHHIRVVHKGPGQDQSR